MNEDCVRQCVEHYVSIIRRVGKRVTKRRLSIITTLCLFECGD